MRKLIILFIIILGACNQHPCDKFPVNYIPNNLTKFGEYLDCILTDSAKNSFKRFDEQIAPFESGLGLYIRNNWNLWKGNNELVEFFNNHGIFHPDDMSTIILISYHRELNNKQIELDRQIEKCKAYWSDSINSYYDDSLQFDPDIMNLDSILF